MSVVIKNVTKKFNDVTVLDSINLSVEKGEIIGLLGTSGCGKSTLLRAIAGLDQHYQGAISINGNQDKQIHDGVQFIFQEPHLLPWFNVADNVNLGIKDERKEFFARAKRLIDYVGLEGKEKFYPKQLSGGMAQRVAIARALVTNPEILLLDEPFSALDAFTKMQLQDLLLEIWAEYQTTMIMVTHDIDEALYLCDRVVVLSGQPGEIIDIIKHDEERPRSRTSAESAHYKSRILDKLNLNRKAI